MSKYSEKDPKEIGIEKKLRRTGAEGYVGKENCTCMNYCCISR